MKKSVKKIAIYKANDGISYARALQAAFADFPDASVNVYEPDHKLCKVFNAKKNDLVIFAGVDCLPGNIKPYLNDYLSHGGRMITLGGPAFKKETYNYKGDWVDRQAYTFRLIDALPDKKKFRIFDAADQAAIDSFGRSSNTLKEPLTKTIGDFGLPGSSAQLKVDINLDNYDNFHYDFTPQGKNFSMLYFWAKGDDHTGGMYLEVIDKFGTRWCSTIRLSDTWQFYALTPSDFKFWKDGKPAQTKQVNFNFAKKFVFGFAQSGMNMRPGHHSYCISSPYLADCGKVDLHLDDTFELDCLAPMYELYPVTNAANMECYPNQAFITPRDYKLPSTLISCHSGRQGTGYGNSRDSRFIPLLHVTDEKGLHAGYAAWVNIFSSVTGYNKNKEGCIVASFSAVSDDFYDENGLAAIVETAKAILSPALLLEGGASEYLYVEPDTTSITAGATYITYAAKTDAEVQVSLYQGDQLLQSAQACGTSRGIEMMSAEYELSAGKPDRAVTTLTLDGKVIDRIEQRIRYWSPKPVEQREYTRIEDGCFIKGGKVLNMFGVNYMPSYGVPERNGRLFEHYVCAAAYDPDVIDYDLAHIKDIGMNAISIFVYNESIRECNNILDLITRAEELGIVTDLSIRRHVYPMDYVEDEVEELIKKLHLDEVDSIVAYDIAWEPRIGTYNDTRYVGRKGWDKDWAAWIVEQYGSVEHAEALWGCPVNRDEQGEIIGVTDEMLDDTTDAYVKIVSAYRRFIDDIVSKIFNEKLRHLRALVPDQLVSLRMSMSGSAMTTPRFKPSGFCYDFSSFASTLDFMEPEGYCLTGSETAALQIIFSNAYNRYIQPGTPVVWKEYGKHVWSGSNFPDGDNGNLHNLLISQEEYYKTSLEYCLRGHTAGMFAWFYAGGFRPGENSDYGIVNPDGSDRPATKLLREYAPKFLTLGKCPAPDVILTVERDDSNRGIFGMYDQAKDALRQAFDEGKSVAFINKKQMAVGDTVYADTTLDEAVGGTAAEGEYPLRYVNGMIKNVEECCDGVKITVCNTLPTVWKASTVSLVADGEVVATIDEDVPYLANVSVCAPVASGSKLRLSIDGKAFGMSYTV